MPELILPTVRLHEAWLEAHREWGPGRHEDGFGLRAEDEVQSPDGFAAWVERLHRRADPRSVTEDGRGPVTFWWVVEDDRVCGGIALRHRLAESQLHLGHVGYGIRPSAHHPTQRRAARGRPGDVARAHPPLLDRAVISP
jgi:predicted acetyltransferase